VRANGGISTQQGSGKGKLRVPVRGGKREGDMRMKRKTYDRLTSLIGGGICLITSTIAAYNRDFGFAAIALFTGLFFLHCFQEIYYKYLERKYGKGYLKKYMEEEV